ncbi:MAG: indole-3-glycerol phosphate synthase TrpC [Candidatus Microthrix subdominans]
MATYLDDILAAHRRAAADDQRSLSGLIEQAKAMAPTVPAADALTAGDRLAVIAEVKRASPSKGDLHPNLNPARLAATYGEAGAAMVSVLTDEDFFRGSAADLAAARSGFVGPLLRKDFTVSPADVCDARLMGADVVLLIAAALDDAELADFAALATEIGLSALVEAHDEAEVERAVEVAGASMIGVNQRDLVTFKVDTARAVRVAGTIPSDVVAIAESGVTGAADARLLADAGYHAVLVGEHLVTSPDPAAALAALAVPRRVG